MYITKAFKKSLTGLGSYFILLKRVFKKPEKTRVFLKSVVQEIDDLCSSSLGIISFMSLFVGAVIAIQMYNNLTQAVFPIPKFYIGYATKMILILEFMPTMGSIILAGKIGSYIASSIGSMRVTEQIDALDIMGINSASYLILPKVVATVLFNPLLIGLGLSLGIYGGYLAGVITQNWTKNEYIAGLQTDYDAFILVYCFIKTTVFAFVIATVPSYFGYKVKGGALAVGRASTKAVVYTSICIIVLDLLLTQMILT